LTKEKEQQMYYKFRVFNAQMDFPIFQNGMVFSNMKELRAAIKYTQCKGESEDSESEK
jgi:hypothetical protein